MLIKEYNTDFPQLSIGFSKAGHEIVDKNEDLSIIYDDFTIKTKSKYYLKIMKVNNQNLNEKIFNAENFGIPQNLPIFYQTNLKLKINLPIVTVGEALTIKKDNPMTYYQQLTSTEQGHDITTPTEAALKRFKSLNEGDNWIALKDYDLQNKTFNAYRRLEREMPAPAMTNVKKDNIIHPIIDRILTPREAAIIQGFPKEYEVGLDDYQRIADTIPPLIGFFIGKQVI